MDYDAIVVIGGGNTHFSSAIFRFVFSHVDEPDRFIPDAEEEYPGFRSGVPVYPHAAFTLQKKW